ncbi:TetR/AcrR family transcriptional regulator [Neotabrizicola sp. VNH66]|uniref:TetR/AcrR family transcriptional regulator n=1 Tax=Neotabrizicola sp. VNH66 TaxID=3400918 RepID=UPI003C03F470
MSVTEAPEIRRGRKYDQVLDGARRVFARDGYEGASVDDIAREAGVSKATLYSYFPDKRLLFTEIWQSECRNSAEAAESDMNPEACAREFLTFAGHRIAAFLMSETGRSLFRLVVAEVSRFPELARTFHANGPALMRERLAGHLRMLVDRGELQIGDFGLAAEQFVQLCKAGFYDRLILGLVDDITPGEVDSSVSAAAEMFLARYGKARP